MAKYKQLEGFSGYRIYPNGTIWSFRRPNPKRLKKAFDKDGYIKCVLINDVGQRKYLRVHRIVAACFIDNIPDGMVVNHIDGNTTNNHFSNLEIITPADNERHARKVLGKRLLGEKASRSKLRNIQVKQIRRLKYKNVSNKLIAETFQISSSQVQRIVSRNNWKHI